MQRKKLTQVVMGAFDTWKAETKKSKQVKKVKLKNYGEDQQQTWTLHDSLLTTL